MMRDLLRPGALRRRIVLVAVLCLVVAACSADTADTTTTAAGPDGTEAPATTEGDDTTETTAPPTGDGDDDDAGDDQAVRFLMAENFWADWTPYSSTALSQRRLERQIYDYLVDFPSGDLNEPEPSLAMDWSQVDDTTWEFNLRDDVTFHDGQPLTAGDVKASVELASGLTGESAYAQTWVPAEVEVLDDHTVRISTEEPFAPMLAELWWTPIVSAAWLDGDEGRLAAEPNGSGPFRVVEDRTDIKTMAPNEEYWQDPPVIDTLIWEFVQDPQTRLNALLSGQAHAIDRVPPEHLETIEADGSVELTSVTGIESVNLWVVPGRLPIWDQSLDFRRAVNFSFDREPLVSNLVMGKSVVAGSFLPTNTLYYQEQSPQFTGDLEVARAALDAAGVPDGGPEFEIWVAEGFLPRAVPVVEAIVNQMEQIGLKPVVVSSDVAGLVDDAFGENGTGAMYHLSWATAGDPNQALGAHPIWATAGEPDQEAADYAEELNDLIDQGRRAIDPTERDAVYADLQAFMWEHQRHVPLYNSDFTLGHVSELQGVRVQPQGFLTDFHEASLAG